MEEALEKKGGRNMLSLSSSGKEGGGGEKKEGEVQLRSRFLDWCNFTKGKKKKVLFEMDKKKSTKPPSVYFAFRERKGKKGKRDFFFIL